MIVEEEVVEYGAVICFTRYPKACKDCRDGCSIGICFLIMFEIICNVEKNHF